MMITPMIHNMLRREDLVRLVDEIASTDPSEAYPAARKLEAGKVDSLLDSPVALAAVRGRGGAPAPLPLALLWYVPIRATLRDRGIGNIDLADFTATLPVAFLFAKATRRVARSDATLAAWREEIHSLPAGTVAQGERAAYCGALALWWAGVFPERVSRRGLGPNMIRAYVDFASGAFDLAARNLQRAVPRAAEVYAGAAARATVLRYALQDTSRDYLGPDAHSTAGRLDRFLARLPPSGEDELPAA
ncbi:MAG: hypothetical protein O7I93_17710 [Gemmatimonadetes bacterium]|nr:hypothetical protein [Gemmatimonadota bacterium]